MEQRTNIAEWLPASYKAMYDLSITVNKSSLTLVQKELIKIRASQVNGCAFCVDMDTSVALNTGTGFPSALNFHFKTSKIKNYG